jgi:predicted methyltransferase
MKRIIGTLRNTPIVEGNRQDLKEGELLFVNQNGLISLHKMVSGVAKDYVVLPLEEYVEILKNTYKEGYEDNK